MQAVQPDLVEHFLTFIRCQQAMPELVVSIGKLAVGSEAYYQRLAEKFVQGRAPKRPQPPSTVPDDFVGLVLQYYFGVAEADLTRIQREHALSMGAENIVGDLLERYIASALEPHGWVWCAGSSLKSVDFIKPPKGGAGKWTLLQVKNRDNSENSSSAAIRSGTPILHWHRSFSRKAGSNWAAFPDASGSKLLSEEGFKAFVVSYLKALKS